MSIASACFDIAITSSSILICMYILFRLRNYLIEAQHPWYIVIFYTVIIPLIISIFFWLFKIISTL